MNKRAEEVIGFICEYEGFDKKEVTMNTNLALDLGLSSLELFDLVNALENAFELGDIKNADISKISTISDAIELINNIKGE